MATFPCPECTRNISEYAESCPQCGYKLAPGEGTRLRERWEEILARQRDERIKKERKRQREEDIFGCGLTVVIISLIALAVFLLSRC